MPTAVVISAGFKEVGEEGAKLELELVAKAREYGLRVLGPNCLGVMNPISGLNATFAAGMANKGRVSFIGQSGALITAILDWSLREGVGFSSIVSMGSMSDVGWGDLIDYLGDDPDTDAIVLYMETVGDARAFLSAVREVALHKPIIVMKPGRTEEASRAAASHTGSMTGSDDVLDAAFRRAGVLRADRISDLFYLAEITRQAAAAQGSAPDRAHERWRAGRAGHRRAHPQRRQAGAHLRGDHRQARQGPAAHLEQSQSHRHHRGRATRSLCSRARHHGQGPRQRRPAGHPHAAGDDRPHQDGPRDHPLRHGCGQTRHGQLDGGSDVEAGERILGEAGVATFPYPDSAALMFTQLVTYSESLKSLYETPGLTPDWVRRPQRSRARQLIKQARAAGRTTLSEPESKELLDAYRIPVAETRTASSADEAVEAANAIGYPVVVKLVSHTITHKSDVGGVRLDLADEGAVREAFVAIQEAVVGKHSASDFEGVSVQPMIEREGYELILGSSIDPQFGPVLLFGLGGTLVEVFKDRSLGLPPLTATLARRMMERTKIYTALKGVRGQESVDMAALEQLLVRFSELVVEQPAIAELDINPLLASPGRLLALDARVILHPGEIADADLPRTAIRPYPRQYAKAWTSESGQDCVIRPIRPEDESLVVDFHSRLSDESVYQRYFTKLGYEQRVAHERMVRVCFTDYDREIALVAEQIQPGTGKVRIAGIVRLIRLLNSHDAEFSLVICDECQGQGLGSEMIRRIIEVARAENVERIVAEVLATNSGMLHICQELGFTIEADEGGETVQASLTLV